MKKKKVYASKKDYSIIIKPIVTEKSASLSAGQVSSKKDKKVDFKSHLAFIVDKKATKTEIRNAITKIFNVEVDSVNTMNYRGKVKRTTKEIGMTKSFKKAYVTLKTGNQIELVEGL